MFHYTRIAKLTHSIRGKNPSNKREKIRRVQRKSAILFLSFFTQPADQSGVIRKILQKPNYTMEFPPANWDIIPVEAGPVHHSPGVYLVPAVGTSSSLYRRESGAYCRDQFFTLLASIWCLLSGPILTILASIWCLLSGPVLHSTSVYLVPAVGTSSSLYWTSSPLYWRVSGACCRDQFFTLLACIWCLLSGPVLHSTGKTYI